MKNFEVSADYVSKQLGKLKPQYAIVLGSGLADLGDHIESPVFINYEDIPEFPQSTVSGHSGRLIGGLLGGVPVICMQGRFHYYEGHSFDKIAIPVRTFKKLGCKALVLTNAAGSLNPNMTPGSLMLIEDHINFSGTNPLIGPNDESIGPRFVDMTQTYDAELNESLKNCAQSMGLTLFQGNYIWVPGPTFETPAEIRAYRTLGADAVGMSTVPEAIFARHCDLKVVGVSTITNLAAGLHGENLSHDETLEQGALAAVNLTKLLQNFLKQQN